MTEPGVGHTFPILKRRENQISRTNSVHSAEDLGSSQAPSLPQPHHTARKDLGAFLLLPDPTFFPLNLFGTIDPFENLISTLFSLPHCSQRWGELLFFTGLQSIELMS